MTGGTRIFPEGGYTHPKTDERIETVGPTDGRTNGRTEMD